MGKKPKTPKKKKKKDPNEPQKPVSAYALFFRDTQAAIKGQNPNATFGEVSKIVASMWDGLGEEQKQVRKDTKWMIQHDLRKCVHPKEMASEVVGCVLVCVCVCVCSSSSHVRLFMTLRTIACQAPLSMRFSRQEYWSQLPFRPRDQTYVSYASSTGRKVLDHQHHLGSLVIG